MRPAVDEKQKFPWLYIKNEEIEVDRKYLSEYTVVVISLQHVVQFNYRKKEKCEVLYTLYKPLSTQGRRLNKSQI